MEIINLDEGVINALNTFTKKPIKKIDKFCTFKKPLVIGSGNAFHVGKILFEGTNAVFADESDYLKKLKDIDGSVIISSFGGKHAPKIAKKLKEKGIKIVLLTNNPNAIAKKYADKTYIFPENPEPYTYNISTYLSMIFSKTGENPTKILKFIQENSKKIPKDLKKYDAFYIIIPEKFYLASNMLLTKFEELFGSKISARVFTFEHTKHAETIVSSNTELFISLGQKNNIFGKNRLNLSLPKDLNYAGFIAYSYYLIGQIQKQNKPYFKQNIKEYIKKASKMFGQKINLIVSSKK
ncbi:MAG: hypothetical protein QT05_C0047G0015 [archaeon GW2011_AR13]|nr:MAG: hypothetical protein QT05_C0047G0015 [archaeon GW2011_AR13]HIG94641.1 hypothetical protein [Nanoarchaeota archaeon]HIH63437.1 hypothetical protein [Nanoarchaeota archaeon]HIJ09367.1 hypothetical protein [Nanoarchaeota archaeon]HLD55597.1 hypothetical protein [Candidatus Nanoarchaeia archaeon]